MSRLFLSASHKSSGKTTVAIGLSAALAARGRQPRVFKKGPDYIDPLWLARASARPVHNLDFNTQSPEEIRALFAAKSAGGGIAIVEGNKGLHDGVDIEGSDSSAALAKLLDSPVVLVIDTAGMTRGIAPLLEGYRAFDPAVDLRGVILNRVATPRQEEKLRAAVERYTPLAVFGSLPRLPDAGVRERHLGLETPGDADAPAARIAAIRAMVETGVDIGRIEAVAASARPLPPIAVEGGGRAADLRIAVARDAAFCFYYADTLEALERKGAKLVFFSPLADRRLPDADALLIGGGFPETRIGELAANRPMLDDIRRAVESGLPVHAECGGLMLLCRSLSFRGETGAMAGAIEADAVVGERPVGRGLVILEAAGKRIPAHEFHHGRLENLDPRHGFAWRVVRGHGVDGRHDGVAVANTVATFSHFRDTSKYRFADEFITRIRATGRPARSNRSA
jgi:cobyrinic acid a,c-diamide synthase